MWANPAHIAGSRNATSPAASGERAQVVFPRSPHRPVDGSTAPHNLLDAGVP